MAKFTNVSCTYTGGGIYVFTGLWNGDVWILSDISDYGTYDINPGIIEEEMDCDYDSHWKNVDYPLPRWIDILNAIRRNYGKPDCINLQLGEVERLFRHYHSNLNARINEEG